MMSSSISSRISCFSISISVLNFSVVGSFWFGGSKAAVTDRRKQLKQICSVLARIPSLSALFNFLLFK